MDFATICLMPFANQIAQAGDLPGRRPWGLWLPNHTRADVGWQDKSQINSKGNAHHAMWCVHSSSCTSAVIAAK